jgi:hypothetical protein
MLQALIRGNKPEKVQSLEWEIREKKRMNVGQVEIFLGGISRTWALNRMRKLANSSKYIRFVEGNKKTKNPSFLIYLEDQLKKGYFEKMETQFESNPVLSLSDIAKLLDLSITTDIFLVRDIVKEFVANSDGKYYLVEENKICKKS